MTTKQKDLPEMHKRAMSVLPEGKDNAIPFEEILKRLGLGKQEERRIRAVLSELVAVYEQPVGCTSVGNPKGFYIITNIDDFLYADRTLKTRELHISLRRRGLERACRHLFYPGQAAELLLEPDEEEDLL